jgi:hypothetical protein
MLINNFISSSSFKLYSAKYFRCFSSFLYFIESRRGVAMESTRDKNDVRRQNIPIIYVKGTHYEVGFDVVSMKSIYSYRLLK